MVNRIIYYYQTLTSLIPILQEPINVTHIHLSSIHFGKNPDNSPYIHLNDYNPNDSRFNQVWDQLQLADEKGIRIVLMIGGAGGAFQDLFSDFELH